MKWSWVNLYLRKLWNWSMVIVTVSACVGTIEDTKVPKSVTVPVSVPTIEFLGVYDAQPVANDKVDVSFFPVTGDAEDFVYLINYDGLSTPITVPALYLKPNYLGLLVYTVTGLDTNASYNFEVQVKNTVTKGYSQSEAQKSATTFANLTANFLGIQNVKTMPGLAGITSVKVQWAEAEKKGSSFVPHDIDPKKYVVTLVNADILSPGDLHNTAYTEPIRKVVYVNPAEMETVIGGLQSDTLYYVSVRCIHHGYTVYGADINYKKEVNSKYMEVRTLKGGLGNLDFNTEGVTLALMPGTQGLTSASAQWEEAVGAFDSYRVYYSSNIGVLGYVNGIVDDICDGQEANPTYSCKQVDYLTTSTILIDMLPNTTYYVVVVVCQSTTCASGTRVLSSLKNITTTPQVAGYAGITSIITARELNKLDEFYLQVTPPDLSSGIMDGVIVEYVNYLGSIIVPLNHPNASIDPLKANISPLNLLSFNFQSATELVVTNIYPFSQTSYCFRAFPYTWENGVVVEHTSNAVAFCKLPEINPPTALEFEGITGCSPGLAPGGVLISWNPPDKGIFSNYEIFVRPTNGGFSFGDAITGDPNYVYNMVNDTTTQYTVEGLVSGQQYRVGVLTYVNINGTIYRSEYNSGTDVCTPD